jgi:hypothetical protein
MTLLGTLSVLLWVCLGAQGGETCAANPRGAHAEPISIRRPPSCSSNLDPEQLQWVFLERTLSQLAAPRRILHISLFLRLEAEGALFSTSLSISKSKTSSRARRRRNVIVAPTGQSSSHCPLGVPLLGPLFHPLESTWKHNASKLSGCMCRSPRASHLHGSNLGEWDGPLAALRGTSPFARIKAIRGLHPA